MCFRRFEKAGVAEQVSEGHLVGLNLHSPIKFIEEKQTSMCFRRLEKAGFAEQVSDGHLVGLNLHSRSSWSSMLGRR